LSKLHGSSYLLRGGLDRFNFLIQADSGTALILNFAGCEKSDDEQAFHKEMKELEAQLRSKSYWGDPEPHPLSEDLRMQIDVINKRDDGVHPAVWDQAIDKGRITIGEKEHKWILYEHRKKLGCANNFPPVVAPAMGKL
jgi:hypothetical protein